MIFRNVTEQTLQEAAREVSVVLNEFRRNGRGFQCTIRPDSAKRWQRVSHSGRKVHAVCWHGHREFFRAIYRREPEAIVITSLARYEGSENFEETFEATGYKNIGSQFQPLDIRNACQCGE